MNPFPLDSVLESLDLSRSEPGRGLLEALFTRFNARIPFETASKIERDAAVADSDAKPRRPHLFWTEHLERGSGGTCFARVAAFEALLSALGFRTRMALGRVRRDFDHAALLVTAGEGSWIADVGFPLPALLPAHPIELETVLGDVRLEATARGWRVDLGGVPEGPRTLEIFAAEVSEAEFSRRWRETFRSDSKFLTEVAMRIEREGRTLSFARGELRVDDAHSRLTVPLPSPRARRLEELFGVDEDLLRSAFARVGDPDSVSGDAFLAAYLEVPAEAGEALSAISDSKGYRRLVAGVADVVSEQPAGDGWILRLRPPESGAAESLLEDSARLESEPARLRVERRSAGTTSESFYETIERGGRTYLVRRLRLAGPREDLLRNDSLRGRLAGSLAAELLGWARLIG
jgi:arylamine N-acetyltransferase